MRIPSCPPASARRPFVLVWVDSRTAVVVRRRDGRDRVERLESDVPARHRSTGHIRHDPALHGGGGWMRDAGDPHRHEHLARWISRVARRLPGETDVAVVGRGYVHGRLAATLRHDDLAHRRTRSVTDAPCGRLTDQQLVALRRRLAGETVRRRTVGSSRWGRQPVRHAGVLPRKAGKDRRARRTIAQPPPWRLAPDPVA